MKTIDDYERARAEHAARIAATYANISRIAERRTAKPKHPILPRAVVNLTTGERFPTMAHASRSIGKNPGAVWKAIAKGWAVGGHRFVLDGEPGIPLHSRPVVRLSTGERFTSMRVASLAMGCKGHALCEAMRRGTGTLRGEQFAFADEVKEVAA